MIKKQYLKSRPVCKVTFSLPAETGINKAEVAGDFNNWQPTSMEPLKSGGFKVVLELEQGNAYQFRYLLDGNEWINDANADNYVPNPFSGENSVVTV